MVKIALVNDERWIEASGTDDYTQNILIEDAQLERAFAEAGAATERVAWSDRAVDWAGFDALLIRQTWDYFERYSRVHRTWLDRIDGTVPVVNPVEVIRWNADKQLPDRAGRGRRGRRWQPEVVAAWRRTRSSLAARMDAAGWNDVVIKPAVSGRRARDLPDPAQ